MDPTRRRPGWSMVVVEEQGLVMCWSVGQQGNTLQVWSVLGGMYRLDLGTQKYTMVLRLGDLERGNWKVCLDHISAPTLVGNQG